MRAVINLSVPESTKKQLNMRAKQMGLSMSSYILNTLDLAHNMISEDQLLKMAKKAEKDYKQGKTKVLYSLKDLW